MKLEVENMSNKKIAILGGTFDPPHLGHFILAEQIKNKFKLDEIIFMPAGKPPHKKNNKISTAEDRLKMLELVISDNKSFSLSDWEIKKEGYSYTAQTLREFVPKLEAEEVFFIIGADSLAEIFNWKEPEVLLSEAKFIVYGRPGYDLNLILNKEVYQPYRDNIYPHQSLNIGISSSFIREELKKGNSIRYLSSDKVWHYILENNLYR